MRLAELNTSILFQRLAVDARLDKAYKMAQAGAFSSIILGMLTTALVALSSSEFGKQKNRTGKIIRIGALVLPALATATAAGIAFYDPAGNLARQSQLESGLQQIHRQMADSVWKFKPVSETITAPDEISTRLDTWAQRYEELLARSGDTRAAAAGDAKSSATSAPEQSQKSQ
jgi:hypothetical protein